MSWKTRPITVITQNPVNFPYRFTLSKAAFEKHKKKRNKKSRISRCHSLTHNKRSKPIIEKYLRKTSDKANSQ